MTVLQSSGESGAKPKKIELYKVDILVARAEVPAGNDVIVKLTPDKDADFDGVLRVTISKLLLSILFLT